MFSVPLAPTEGAAAPPPANPEAWSAECGAIGVDCSVVGFRSRILGRPFGVSRALRADPFDEEVLAVASTDQR